MTGGLYSSVNWNFDKTPTFTVTLSPSSWGSNGSLTNINVYLERRTNSLFNTWRSADQSSVGVSTGGTVTLRGDEPGLYRIYIYNGSQPQRVTGSIRIPYSS